MAALRDDDPGQRAAELIKSGWPAIRMIIIQNSLDIPVGSSGVAHVQAQVGGAQRPTWWGGRVGWWYRH